MSGRDKALNIFNKDYQEARVEFGKQENKNWRMGFAENCCLGIFKHLVHIFVLIIAMSFGVMMYIVAMNNEDGFDIDIDWHVSAVSYYIDNHPSVYGLKVMAEKNGKNFTVKDGLKKFVDQ